MGGLALTAFGAVFLPVAAALLAWRPRWLPGLLMVSAVFQAPAVAVLRVDAGDFGITPFNAASAFLLAGVAMLAFRERTLPPIPSVRDPLLVAWLAFFACTVLGAMLLPRLFAGVPVYPLLTSADLAATVPNAWSLSHLAQALNGAALACVFLAFAWMRDRAALLRAVVVGLGIALLLSAVIAAWQRMAKWEWVPLFAEFWSSNPTYIQKFEMPYWGRVGLPFIEPSYASVWFAGMAGAAFAAAVYGRRHRSLLLLASVVSTAALVNSGGTSGVLALAGFWLVLLAWHAWRGRRIADAGGHLVLAASCAAAGIAAATIAMDMAWLRIEALAPMRENLDWIVLKLEEESGGRRLQSNLHALGVLAQTRGLGAGAGSTRASSWLVSLLANNGVVGLSLFVMALVWQCKRLWSALPERSTAAAGALGAALAGGIGVAGGIPDQNWPVWWIFLLFGFAVASRGTEPRA